MSRKITRPLLKNLSTFEAIEARQKEKEDRFKQIAFNQPNPALARKANTPSDLPGPKQYTPKERAVRSQMSPNVQFLSPRGVLSPVAERETEGFRREEGMNTSSLIEIGEIIMIFRTWCKPLNRIAEREQQDEHPHIYIEPQPVVGQLFGDGFENPIMQVRRNMAISITDAVSESICINSVLLFISTGKMVAYFAVLIGSEKSCKESLTLWLLAMFCHDVIHSWYVYLVLQTIRNSEYHEDPHAQGGFVQVPRSLGGGGQPRHYSSQFLNEIDEWDGQRQINAFAIQERASSSNNLTLHLSRVTKQYEVTFINSFYIFLFVIGNYIVLGDTTCALTSPTHFNLAVTYVILGYAYLGVPILLFSSLCLCLPFVLLMYLVVSRYEGQRPIRRDILEVLEKVRFNPANFPGNKDCCICMVDYREGDDVTILPCNRMHHFHEECVKKWLLINGVCPICRKPIEESVRQFQHMNA